LSEIKEKYLKVTWNDLEIQKLELVEQKDSNFFVKGIMPTIENILDMLHSAKPEYIFEVRPGNFLTATLREEVNGISIKCVINDNFVDFSCEGLSDCYSFNTKSSNMNIAKSLFAMFNIKNKQKIVKRKLKNQLKCLGYIPQKIKKEDVKIENGRQTLFLKVNTEYGRLSMSVDENGCTLEHVQHEHRTYRDVEEIEENIARVRAELESLEKLKSVFLDVRSEVANCAVVYDVKKDGQRK